MTNNNASVNIRGSVDSSKVEGGEVHNTTRQGFPSENDVSLTIGGNLTGLSYVKGGKIYEYPEKFELKAEIQKLLNEPKENPRTAKETVAVEIIKEEINDRPNLRQRLLSALKAGGVEALKEIFDHPVVSIPVETIKGFLEAG